MHAAAAARCSHSQRTSRVLYPQCESLWSTTAAYAPHGRYDVHTAADELVAPMVYFAKLNATDGSVAHRPPLHCGTRPCEYRGYRTRSYGPYVLLVVDRAHRTKTTDGLAVSHSARRLLRLRRGAARDTTCEMAGRI